MPKRPTQIAVLDYVSGEVTIYTALIENDSEVIEEYLAEKGHSLSNIYYMSGEAIEVNYENDLN